MKELNLPPFYVGQKVVCIDNSDTSGSDFLVSEYFTKGKQYEVQKIKTSCCGWVVHVGVIISNEPGWVVCLNCKSIEWDNGDDLFWVFSNRFAPVQENFQSISLEKILEKETSLISAS